MPISLAHARRMTATALAVAVSSAVGACSGDTNPVRDVIVSVGAGPRTTPTPGFIAESRPAKVDYIPVGTIGPGRPTPARTAAEVKAAEAELDSIRTANEAAAQAARQAGATPLPQPATAAPPAKPKKPKTQAPASQ